MGGIEAEGARRVFVGGLVRICADLDVEVAAEGVETKAECCALRGLGATLFQGSLSARPAFMAVPAKELRRISAG